VRALLAVVLLLALAGGLVLVTMSRAPAPAPAGGAKGPGTGPAPAGVPTKPAVPATKEACLAYLRERAGPAPAGLRTTDFDDEVRAAALEALSSLPGGVGDAAVAAAFEGDGDASSFSAGRMRAAAILARAGKEGAGEVVRLFVASEEEIEIDLAAAAEAARAAAFLPPADAAAVLRALLASPAVSEDDDVAAEVLRTVATLGAGATADTVRPFLGEPHDLPATAAAAGALARLGDAAGVEWLNAHRAALLEDDTLALALAARGNGAVLPSLRAAAATDDDMVRAAAAVAFGIVGDASSRADLERLADADDADVRAEAAAALVALGDPSKASHLVAAVGASGDVDVRLRAWKALATAAKSDPAARTAAAALLAKPEDTGGRRYYDRLERIAAARYLLAIL
jgi:HEAT repeat protein